MQSVRWTALCSVMYGYSPIELVAVEFEMVASSACESSAGWQNTTWVLGRENAERGLSKLSYAPPHVRPGDVPLRQAVVQ